MGKKKNKQNTQKNIDETPKEEGKTETLNTEEDEQVTTKQEETKTEQVAETKEVAVDEKKQEEAAVEKKEEPVVEKKEEPAAVETKEEPKKEATKIQLGINTASGEESSGFEILDKSQQKAQKPKPVGILAYKKEDYPQEIESPFRKKKSFLQKIKTEDSGDEAEIKANKFESIDPYFKTVMSNFADKKAQFEVMKKKTAQEQKQMYLNDELQTLFKNWQKGLELQIPDGTEVEESLLAAFNQEKQSELKDIEQFLQIVHDWIDETIHEVEASGVTKPKTEETVSPQKRQSIEKLQRATMEAQERQLQQIAAAENARKKQHEIMKAQKKKEQEENELIAKQIESLAEDEDLLAGLEECAKLEQKELDEKKKKFTPREETKKDDPIISKDQQAGQGEQKSDDKPEKESKKDEQGSNVLPGVLIVVAAIAVAGAVYALRKVKR